MANELSQSYAFGDAIFDLRARQLWIRNQAIDVQPKVFDLIAYLLRHRDRVVSKDELFDEVWPDVVVSEATLSQTVKRARDLFREHGFEEGVIRTLPRRGFQFAHPLNPADPPPVAQQLSASGSQARRRTWPALVLLTLVVVTVLALLPAVREQGTTQRKIQPTLPSSSLAVLPFESLTADPSYTYLADGVTESIINNLTQLDGLRIIARTSAYAAAREQRDRSEIARDLKVAHLLIGSVQVQDEELRVSASLISAGDGSQLWSQQYTRLLDDVFAVQDEISRVVASELASTLGQSYSLSANRSKVEDVATSRAYRIVLRARQARRNGSKAFLDEAEKLFRDAIQTAPNYPTALVGLADVLQVQAVLGERERSSSLTEAIALLNRATRIDPEYGGAFSVLAVVQYRHLWNFAAARESFERALALQPGSSEIRSRFSRFLAKAGDHPQAAEQAWLAADLNPRSVNTLNNLALRMMRDGQLKEARDAIDTIRSLERDRVDLPWLEAHWHLAANKPREALEWIAQEELAYLRLNVSAIALHHLGRDEQAEKTLQELIDTDKEAAFQIAESFAQFGDMDRSFSWLNTALSAGDPGLAELYSSPFLEPLYADERFAQFADQVGLPSRMRP
ncbi:MAG: winged helix-turn-helix domain-containing protein [Pseudomonadota bacterium]